MDKKALHEIAPSQLDRVLSFFARVEAKASFLFAVNSALLGTLAIHIQKSDLVSPPNVASLGITLILLGLSFYFIYRCSFPNLSGGNSSLIYFAEIAKLREQEYLKSFRAMTDDEFADDILAQTWRNAAILTSKFRAIRTAFILTGLGLVPWAIFLALASIGQPILPVPK